MNNKACCFTGHRTIPKSEIPRLQNNLEETLTTLIDQGVECFGAGGALGFDTMAALTVLTLKKKYPDIKLILVLPCKNQTRGWDNNDIKIYNHIRNEADKVVYTSEHYDSGCMHKRNRHLADNSGFCVCYLTKPSGGTAYTVSYARRKGVRIINLAGTG